MSQPIDDDHPFADLIGLRFTERAPGHSVCVLELGPSLMNPHRVAHGAVLYALADTGHAGWIGLNVRVTPSRPRTHREIV